MNAVDASVVGAGPNGLAAAVVLARAGLSVNVYEARDTVGGGTRTEQLIEPGHWHDICSAVHPLAFASPFFAEFGIKRRIDWFIPEISYGHPLDDGRAALAYRSLERTVTGLGRGSLPPLNRTADPTQRGDLRTLLETATELASSAAERAAGCTDREPCDRLARRTRLEPGIRPRGGAGAAQQLTASAGYLARRAQLSASC